MQLKRAGLVVNILILKARGFKQKPPTRTAWAGRCEMSLKKRLFIRLLTYSSILCNGSYIARTAHLEWAGNQGPWLHTASRDGSTRPFRPWNKGLPQPSKAPL